jgi:VRR-NUC domain
MHENQRHPDDALLCILPAHLKLWFVRLARDIRANRTGFPDLIRFWPAQRRYEMVEVKGPGDRLQDQIRWLAYCADTACRFAWSTSGGRMRRTKRQ